MSVTVLLLILGIYRMPEKFYPFLRSSGGNLMMLGRMADVVVWQAVTDRWARTLCALATLLVVPILDVQGHSLSSYQV
jgi:hypothetical protein